MHFILLSLQFYDSVTKRHCGSVWDIKRVPCRLLTTCGDWGWYKKMHVEVDKNAYNLLWILKKILGLYPQIPIGEGASQAPCLDPTSSALRSSVRGLRPLEGAVGSCHEHEGEPYALVAQTSQHYHIVVFTNSLFKKVNKNLNLTRTEKLRQK